jgi:hypothetical protein
MSDMLRAGTLTPEIAPRLLGPVLHPAPGASHAPDDFRAAIETLALATLQARQFVLEPFVAVLAALPLPFDELFRLYVGKNVLNSFRLAHGYKTGTYAKRWGDREDNEHLVELLEGLVCSPEDVPDVLYAELATRYRALTA